MINKEMFGGIAIISLIAALWSKIKLIFEKISSYIFVKVELGSSYGNLDDAISGYLFQNYKRSPFGVLSFGTSNEYLKSFGKRQVVAFEKVGNNSILFWNKCKPIFLYIDNNNDKKITTRLLFIRGTFNANKLIINAIDEYNTKINGCFSKQERRFYIRKFIGTSNNSNNNESNREVTVDRNDFIIGSKKLLKWSILDIGFEENDPKKSLNSLVFSKNINSLIEEIVRWKKSKQWYEERNIPWKRGWLLHGKPGTGKTSLVRGLAEYLDLPIFIFDISTLNNDDFTTYWKQMLQQTPCIALIEDLDTVFDKRENVTKSTMLKNPLSFDCLLNCIDGIEKSNGLFTIITTNKLEKIDNAIGSIREYQNGTMISTRPGRIDRTIELKSLDKECRRKLAKRILKDYPNIIEEFVENGNGDTAAQFQERCTQITLKLFWENNK